MRRALLVILILGIIGLAALVGYGFVYTSDPSFCASCHLVEPFAESWKGTSHEVQGVDCTDCHFEPGAFGYMKGKVYSIIKLFQWLGGETERPPEAARTVVAGSCRHCHEDPVSTFIPHAYHTEVANLQCVECHSGIVHGAELVGEEKPQAAADPAFCSSCHTGDIAPILFGPIEPAGREHPGAPKIDVDVWRNIHWRVANAPAVIDGVPYDQIEPETCAACHEDPTQARACKGCHFARVPEFRVATTTQRASGVPLAIFGLMFVLLMLTVILRTKDKARLFASRWMQLLVAAIVISDIVVVYFIIRDTLVRETGSLEIGPTTVWITYLLVSAAVVLLVIYEGLIRPGHMRFVMLPGASEDEIYVPDHNVWVKQEGATTEVVGDAPDPHFGVHPGSPSPPPPTTPPTAEPPAEEAPSPKEPE